MTSFQYGGKMCFVKPVLVSLTSQSIRDLLDTMSFLSDAGMKDGLFLFGVGETVLVIWEKNMRSFPKMLVLMMCIN